eukprot:NODE_5784_length_909_cov_131.146310_g5559_i0.p1 GENE.NODE_5784_length_909_cov_131.146310_g5559_i0~~NODE_5784_length_909_cov_131.146310_g5559_i0.p1  ORF type:complete len:205 (-),score=28.48 NODE_5784_length_909_cov_131.146310_g5559_i0:242-856(-)
MANIVYVMIAQGVNPLCSFGTGEEEDHASVCTSLLEKIPPHDSRMSYAQGTCLFHYIMDNTIVYIAVAPEGSGKRAPFVFLEAVKRRFKADHPVDPSGSMAPCPDFESILAELAQEHRQGTTIATASPPEDSLTENFPFMAQRREPIDVVIDRTMELANHADEYQRIQTAKRRRALWMRVRIYVLAGLVAFVLLLALVALLSLA